MHTRARKWISINKYICLEPPEFVGAATVFSSELPVILLRIRQVEWRPLRDTHGLSNVKQTAMYCNPTWPVI